MLLQVYEACAKEYANSDQKVITVMVNALADFVKTCSHRVPWSLNFKKKFTKDVFQFVKFEIART